MENIFSFNRFGLLVRKHAHENWKTLIISFILLSATALLTTGYDKNSIPKFFYYIYINTLVIVGGVYTGLFFRDWTHKARAVSLLMLPTTAFEKIALVVFYAVILFIPLFTFAFYGYYFTASKIFYTGNPFSISMLYHDQAVVFAFLYILLPYAFFQSLFLLFSIWLNKRQFLISMAMIIIILIVVYFWNILYIQWMTGNNWVMNLSPFLMFKSTVFYEGAGHSSKIYSKLIAIVSILIYVIMTVLFYLASYFKLKEKEI